MRTFACLCIIFFMVHFGIRVGLLGIILAFALLVAFFQDVKELAALGSRK